MLFPGIASLVMIFVIGSLTGFSQGKVPSPSLTISNASINYGAGTLTVTGTNLGQMPTVTLGTTALSKVLSDGTTSRQQRQIRFCSPLGLLTDDHERTQCD